jgi:hypothetical protein
MRGGRRRKGRGYSGRKRCVFYFSCFLNFPHLYHHSPYIYKNMLLKNIIIIVYTYFLSSPLLPSPLLPSPLSLISSALFYLMFTRSLRADKRWWRSMCKSGLSGRGQRAEVRSPLRTPEVSARERCRLYIYT